jgi:two-component system cell cycle response regulator
MTPENSNLELDVLALNFATRNILSNLDHGLIVEHSLESLADFGRTQKVGIFLTGGPGNTMVCQGAQHSLNYDNPSLCLPMLGSPCLEVMRTKNPGIFHLQYKEGIPWPSYNNGERGRQCLVAPLVVADNKVIGVTTFDHPAGWSLKQSLSQPLSVLLTVVAAGLETARLFKLAVVDGLTGLYVRRYFDLRLAEEEARVRRYGGRLGLLMLDLDHFKKLNDTYGHQAGDAVLRQLARIISGSMRQDLDVACRYGGEEFVVILPSTDTRGILAVAERIRKACRDREFESPSGPLKVTLSGGAALMSHRDKLGGQELLARADKALYEAKRNGRNQVAVWRN